MAPPSTLPRWGSAEPFFGKRKAGGAVTLNCPEAERGLPGFSAAQRISLCSARRKVTGQRADAKPARRPPYKPSTVGLPEGWRCPRGRYQARAAGEARLCSGAASTRGAVNLPPPLRRRRGRMVRPDGNRHISPARGPAGAGDMAGRGCPPGGGGEACGGLKRRERFASSQLATSGPLWVECTRSSPSVVLIPTRPLWVLNNRFP